MENTNIQATVKIGEEASETITISIEEYTHLKDTETRFTILKNQMMNAEYCPIHTQIILGIEEAYKHKQELKTDLMPQKEENA